VRPTLGILVPKEEAVRHAFWIPREDRRIDERHYERPYLEAPSPWENMPWNEQPPEPPKEDEGSRVVIIDL
jgi:hypothetical protein